jgi:putative ABC transport system permease protein
VPDPPPAGHAWADSRLEEAGVSVGDTLLVGPNATPVVVDGWVEDTSYLQQAGLWVDLPTWRTVQNANRPDAFVADDVVQVLVVRGSGDLTAAIDGATGTTSSLTRDGAVDALPGVREQQSTFNAIIYSTLAVVLAVIGLFFSLLTLERTGLYGVLKAIGASSSRLFAGVVVQAVVVAVVAFVVGSTLALLGELALPAEVPLQLTPGRFVFTFIALVVAAVLGSAISLRRVTRIDPASAIGSAA